MTTLLSQEYETKKIEIEYSEGFAWDRKTILSFLKEQAFKDIVILGGDVLEKNQEGSLELNGSGWFSERKGPLSPIKVIVKDLEKKPSTILSLILRKKSSLHLFCVMSLQLVYKCLSNQSLSDVS